MKKIAILLFSLLFVNLLFAQEGGIKISNETSKKEIIIKENKRIKIKTTDGRKISGRFKVEDGNTILIKNERIDFSDIESIKRNSLVFSILTSSLLIYAGVITIGVAVIIAALGESSAYLLTIPAAGLIYTGIKPPNFQKKYKSDSNWSFKGLKTIPENI